jgi:hypothetical protein
MLRSIKAWSIREIKKRNILASIRSIFLKRSGAALWLLFV